MSKSCSLHPKGTVRHAYLRVDWDTKELSLIHECRDPTSGEPGDDGGVPTHEWPETVKDTAAVLRRLGLSRIEAEPPVAKLLGLKPRRPFPPESRGES